MELAQSKIDKALDSLHRALNNLKNENKREAIGDLNFVKENAQEAIWIILAELEDEKEMAE